MQLLLIATKLVPSLRNLSYKECLIALNLPTLVYRRKRGDIIMVLKIMKGIVDLNYTTFFKLSTNNTRGHELKLFKQRSRLNVRRNFFSQRIVESWNALPEEIVSCTTVLHFEKLYDSFHCERKYNFNGFIGCKPCTPLFKISLLLLLRYAKLVNFVCSPEMLSTELPTSSKIFILSQFSRLFLISGSHTIRQRIADGREAKRNLLAVSRI